MARKSTPVVKNTGQPAKSEPVPADRAKQPTALKHASPPSAKRGGLDAAHAVLVNAGTPMTVQAIAKEIFARKLWTSGGKTPHATIAAAIMREIAAKSAKSKFVKAGRGLFAANANTGALPSSVTREDARASLAPSRIVPSEASSKASRESKKPETATSARTKAARAKAPVHPAKAMRQISTAK